MLKSIYIDNYALIERLEIEFREGLTIITGETGAGKTILLGALGLLLGKRADSSIMRDPERKCVVEGLFRVREYHLEEYFERNELDFTSEITIRREISANGKSRAFVNDTPVNLDLLQDLTLSLIDIHSQHQNLSLNDESYLRWIIDSYAGTTELAGSFELKYREYQKLKKNYLDARDAFQKNKDDLEYLNHQFNELQSADIRENELHTLEQEYDTLAHAEEIKSGLQEVLSILELEETGIILQMKQIHDLFSRIKTHLPDVSSLEERVLSIYIEGKDIARESSDHFNKIEFDPAKMEQIRQRIDVLLNLYRKYKVNSETELLGILQNLDDRLHNESIGEFQIEQMAKELDMKEDELKKAARILSDSRSKIFPEFESKVISLLKMLGMVNADFSLRNQITEIAPNGIDKIQFLFSSNKNVSLQNISKIASGGELSRLMLAIKYLISGTSGLPTILFDEIDSGVSGEIADKVGNLVREMSAGMQVINITHLPQVASKGDQHYLVYKTTTSNSTNTYIRKLNEMERVNEIAKMLSGDSISDAAIENAKVLLKNMKK